MKLNRKEFLRTLGAVGATLATGLAALGPGRARADVVRPPGALDEDEFLARCIRCGRCSDACPNQAITSFTPAAGRPFSLTPGPGQRWTPVIFPRRQACNLCASDSGEDLLCTTACPTGALVRIRKDPDEIRQRVAMGTAVVDPHLCFSLTGSSCGVCIRACPLEGGALRAGRFESPVIDPDQCVGCGLCERACIRYPQAITVRPAGRRTA